MSLTRGARQDIRGILAYTLRTFGTLQFGRYRDLIARCVRLIQLDPVHPASKSLDGVAPGLRTLHLRHAAAGATSGRHVLVYVTRGNDIFVLRVLHDSMDLPRHLPAADDALEAMDGP